MLKTNSTDKLANEKDVREHKQKGKIGKKPRGRKNNNISIKISKAFKNNKRYNRRHRRPT